MAGIKPKTTIATLVKILITASFLHFFQSPDKSNAKIPQTVKKLTGKSNNWQQREGPLILVKNRSNKNY